MHKIDLLRNQLLPIAYQMLGQLQDAEDIVQEIIIERLENEKSGKQATISNITGYYVKATINKSLNLIKKQNRLTYTGVWLPEPIPTDFNKLDYKLDIPYAFVFYLSRLNPKERAVFLLRESFDFPFREIAKSLKLSADNCRKLFERGKSKLKKEFTSTQDDIESIEKLATEFLHAANTGNLNSLLNKLTEDITLYSDGGGKVSAAIKPIVGSSHVMKFLIGIQKQLPNTTSIKITTSENNLFVLFYEPGSANAFTVMNFEVIGGKIKTIYIQRNPDKLKSC